MWHGISSVGRVRGLHCGVLSVPEKVSGCGGGMYSCPGGACDGPSGASRATVREDEQSSEVVLLLHRVRSLQGVLVLNDK